MKAKNTILDKIVCGWIGEAFGYISSRFLAVSGLLALAAVASTSKADSNYLPKINVPAKVAALESQSAGLMSQATHKKMQRVHGYMQNKKFDNAVALLGKLEASARSRPGELAQIYQTMGFTYIEQKKEKTAIKYFEKALELRSLPKGPTLSTMYMLAQLYLSEDNYSKGTKILLDWFAASESPGAGAYALLANIYAQKGQKKAAFANIDKAIRLEKTPSKAWLQLATALAFELKKYPRAAVFLKVLTARFPEEKSHWKQLAGVYIHLEKGKESLATLELAHKAGHLDKQADILHLVSMYLNRGIPYWAAMVMEEGFEKKILKKTEKNLYLMGQCYMQAEEKLKALKPLREAAAKSKAGKVDLMMGQVLLDVEEWLRASKSFEAAIKKGGLSETNKGLAYLGHGMSLMELKQYSKAQKAFEQALATKATKKSAEQWLASIEVM
ncbi:MAG: hypothetical protein HRT45_13640 [Bdellovibrionales bacterium]|nr:hypothetical protein [Bdellovibrionales bacterium]